MLFHLGYVSTETRKMTRTALLDLVKSARARNLELNITGVLLHRDDSFFQVLEGEQDDIQSLYRKISLDDRHQRVELLFEEAIDQREFASWGMEIKDLDDAETGSIPGLAELISSEQDAGAMFRTLPKVRQMLKLFQTIS